MLNIYGLIVQSVMDRVENSTLTWVRTCCGGTVVEW